MIHARVCYSILTCIPLSDYTLQNRLKREYNEASSNVDDELKLVRQALNTVYQIRSIRHDLRIQVRASLCVYINFILCVHLCKVQI